MKKTTNVNFILKYLGTYPGAKYEHITKALCLWKDKPWNRGMYCRYFIRNPSNQYNCNTGKTYYAVVYPGHLWIKDAHHHWYLTYKGRQRLKELNY